MLDPTTLDLVPPSALPSWRRSLRKSFPPSDDDDDDDDCSDDDAPTKTTEMPPTRAMASDPEMSTSTRSNNRTTRVGVRARDEDDDVPEGQPQPPWMRPGTRSGALRPC